MIAAAALLLGLGTWFAVRAYVSPQLARGVTIKFVTRDSAGEITTTVDIDSRGDRRTVAGGSEGSALPLVRMADTPDVVALHEKSKEYSRVEPPNGAKVSPGSYRTEAELARDSGGETAEILGRKVYVFRTYREDTGKPLGVYYVAPEFGMGFPLKVIRYDDEGGILYVKEAVSIERYDGPTVRPGPEWRAKQ